MYTFTDIYVYIYVYVEHIAHCVTFFNSCSAGFVYFFDRMVRICVCRFVIVCKMRRFCWYVYFVFGCVVMFNAFLHCFFFPGNVLWVMFAKILRGQCSNDVIFRTECVLVRIAFLRTRYDNLVFGFIYRFLLHCFLFLRFVVFVVYSRCFRCISFCG